MKLVMCFPVLQIGRVSHSVVFYTDNWTLLLLLAISAGSAQAQKISDLESEPAATAQPEVTQVGDWGVICDANDESSCAMTMVSKSLLSLT